MRVAVGEDERPFRQAKNLPARFVQRFRRNAFVEPRQRCLEPALEDRLTVVSSLCFGFARRDLRPGTHAVPEGFEPAQRDFLNLRLDEAGHGLAALSCSSWMSLRDRPSAVFQSTRPLELRPSSTPEAVDGEPKT